jgi:phage terminase small subunit
MTSNVLADAKKLGMLAILQKVMSGQTLEEAAQGSGYSTSTFRRMLQENEGVAKELIESQRQIIEGQFNAVAVARQRLISNLLRDAEDPKLPTAMKLAVEERLHQMQTTLGNTMGVGTTEIHNEAREYLTGMALRPGRARVTQTKTVVEFDPSNRQAGDDVIDLDLPADQAGQVQAEPQSAPPAKPAQDDPSSTPQLPPGSSNNQDFVP